MARHRPEEGHDALAHQRLAAGDPQLAHAERDEGRAEPVELLERQQLGLGQELHVLGHAVDAAEVAAIGHRHAQIADRPRERIDQLRCGVGRRRLPSWFSIVGAAARPFKAGHAGRWGSPALRRGKGANTAVAHAPCRIDLCRTASAGTRLRAGFRWPRRRGSTSPRPAATDGRATEPERLALRYLRPDGEVRDWSFGAAGPGVAAARQRPGGARGRPRRPGGGAAAADAGGAADPSRGLPARRGGGAAVHAVRRGRAPASGCAIPGRGRW